MCTQVSLTGLNRIVKAAAAPPAAAAARLVSGGSQTERTIRCMLAAATPAGGKSPRLLLHTLLLQVEGAWDKDGRTPSVWDAFSHIPGKIKNNDNGGCMWLGQGRLAD